MTGSALPPRDPATPLRLLFVCVENSNRSQMAEAFGRLIGGARVECFSAGSKPSGQVNPRAIASMREVGYDLSVHRSKSVIEVPAGTFDAVVSMGCGDACPAVPARLREDWQIQDPKLLPPERFAEVREQVRSEVAGLIARLL